MGQWRLELIAIETFTRCCPLGAKVSVYQVILGAADVVMPLVTGGTWFKVPETVEIRFKRYNLHVLGELKRNTVAYERAYWPGLKYLSCDAHLAISNMATEFGDIAAVFEGDPGAVYAETHIIDLSKVDSLIASYPSPDDVVPAKIVEGKKLDGVFIGAEEDLILAALVLEQGLKKGYRPSIGGKRRVTPGSLPIIAKLRRIGLVRFYEQAGFAIGTLTELREIWLSSQNQNFRNRMGKGVIGNLASTATVAVSSFEMKIKDPRELLDLIDPEKYKEFLEQTKPTLADPNNPSSLGSYLPPPPPSFTGSITGKVQVFEDNW
ncbi:hypothetical protein Glove_365g226 [Diversispora epigaea]|uniref:Uncharacterized protein n=1 Tax=Diversispora epigaea TaxID=1348612 RepID=A0A397H7U6_9GLOM|nr:hypothetical protein Glove_365g226 [Diversispora epigaea]